jgi:hypothetical protein
MAGHDAEAQSALTQFFQHHPEFSPSGSLTSRLFAGFAMRPPILTDALRRLGLKVADAGNQRMA